MSLIPSENTELKNYLNEKEFIQLTIDQINKDLHGLTEINIQSTKRQGELILDELIKDLSSILRILAKNHYQNLMQCLYRIDLHETKFISSVSQDPELNHLAFLIIEREAKKVYLRKRFKA